MVVTARGGAYGPGSPREGCDFQVPYLRAYFRKQRVAGKNVHVVTAELTLAGVLPHLARFQPHGARSQAAARAEVATLAAAISRPEKCQ